MSRSTGTGSRIVAASVADEMTPKLVETVNLIAVALNGMKAESL